jgi:hypothetical protein
MEVLTVFRTQYVGMKQLYRKLNFRLIYCLSYAKSYLATAIQVALGEEVQLLLILDLSTK